MIEYTKKATQDTAKQLSKVSKGIQTPENEKQEKQLDHAVGVWYARLTVLSTEMEHRIIEAMQ